MRFRPISSKFQVWERLNVDYIIPAASLKSDRSEANKYYNIVI